MNRCQLEGTDLQICPSIWGVSPHYAKRHPLEHSSDEEGEPSCRSPAGDIQRRRSDAYGTHEILLYAF